MNFALLSEDEYLVKKELTKLINKYNEKYNCEIIEYDANVKDFNMSHLLNDLNTLPFLNDHRVVILNNPLFLSAKGSIDDASISGLEAYLQDPADFSTLIVYVDDFKVDRRKKISKSIIKHSEVFDPKPIDDSMIQQIIERDLHKNNISLDRKAKNELFKRMLGAFNNWDSELEKLVLYAKQELDMNDITLLISENEGDNIFDLVNSVLEKNLNLSLLTYRNLPRKDSEPIALAMLLANQFRLVHQVATLANTRMDNGAIASELKVHPYRVQLARALANKYSTSEILSVLNKLSNLEQSIKGGNINPHIGFELFLIEVCTA